MSDSAIRNAVDLCSRTYCYRTERHLPTRQVFCHSDVVSSPSGYLAIDCRSPDTRPPRTAPTPPSGSAVADRLADRALGQDPLLVLVVQPFISAYLGCWRTSSFMARAMTAADAVAVDQGRGPAGVAEAPSPGNLAVDPPSGLVRLDHGERRSNSKSYSIAGANSRPPRRKWPSRPARLTSRPDKSRSRSRVLPDEMPRRARPFQVSIRARGPDVRARQLQVPAAFETGKLSCLTVTLFRSSVAVAALLSVPWAILFFPNDRQS